jgi:Uma2 family endonuclease
MAIETATAYVTREEYLAMERASTDIRHEWIDGEIRDMPGGTHEHGMVASNLTFVLNAALKGRPFVVHPHDMKVRVPEDAYYYPDVVVVPHPPELEDDRSDIVVNPLIVFEVLSPSTAAIDRGEKLDRYRRIPSLTDYLIVSRDRPAVDQWSRHADGEWRLTIVDDLAAELSLSSLGCKLSLADVYDRLFDDD